MGKPDLSGKYIFDHEDGNCAKYGQEAGIRVNYLRHRSN